MRKAEMEYLCERVLLIKHDVTSDVEKAVDTCLKELPTIEQTVLKHYCRNKDFKLTGKILELPPKYIRYQYKKAIRHLRAPRRYYRMLLGDVEYNRNCNMHYGFIPVSGCHFTTKTENVLKKNGFVFIEELEKYIGNVPERFAYIEGLGKFGASEVLYYFMERSAKK